MANQQLFSNKGKTPKTDTVNRAGGKAYELEAKAALAQYAATGMLGSTFYAKAEDHLDAVLELAKAVPPKYLAQVAVYARRTAHLKDMPALLLSVLATRDTELFKQVFPLVIDNGRMVRNFVQIMRSGAVGRTSLGSAPKKAVQTWLRNQSDEYIFKASVGNSPSLADVIRLVHPRPKTKSREALYRYLIGLPMKGYKSKLPKIVKEFEKFKTQKAEKRQIPDVPFQMLTALDLSEAEWSKIAENGAWQFTRMNLNTFERHGVFKDSNMVKMIADRLQDEGLVLKSRNYPYQMFTSFKATSSKIPAKVRNALQTALDHSFKNVPDYSTILDKPDVHVLVDVSASMGGPVSGHGYHTTSEQVAHVDVGALFAAAIRVQNDEGLVIAFNNHAQEVDLNARDSIITNATKVRECLGGGTDCSAPLRYLNIKKATGDLVVMISDYESWYSVQSKHHSGPGFMSGSTDMMQEWKKYKNRNPKAVLVCIDTIPQCTTQAVGKDVLLVGGFNDKVFDVIATFLEAGGDDTHWVKEIEKTSLKVN